VTFEDAARRTAQMAYDLRFEGAPVFFSWPSQGSLLGYTVDEANVEYARSDLRAFIAEFARTSKAEQIYLVAHSMGNRALTAAVVDLFREAPDVKAKIKEIILAAPDIDADVFKRDIAPAIAGKGQPVTLYASSNDWALAASKKFHGYSRAGDTGQALTVVPGVVTIDSSEVETDFLGHSYFAESTSIIADMFDILSGITKPEDRRHLVPVDAQVGRYWKIPNVAE
jgi:esterase/lipase superfamily enzyme